MAKKDKKGGKDAKKARTAEKNAKAQAKSEVKNKKLGKKHGLEEEEDVDIDELLKQYADQQESFEAIQITTCKPPSKRLNAAMAASPTHGKRELFLFGGESTNGSMAVFYNDLFQYSVDSDTWRKIVSKNSPLPRSGHAMGVHPSGVIVMFGGEFSSPKQSTFYHYGDTWILDAASKQWTKIEIKKGPSARSGHRMVAWKNYIILHGGFRDLAASTTYLDDFWVFDITTYKWQQVEFPPNHPIPDARSGHSFIPCADGGVLWGGYCKVKAGKGLQKGKVLTDCWLLKMKADTKQIRWERRKKQGFQPSPRVGCSMVPHKGRGVMFGGVYDFEETEESLASEFYNTLLTYQTETNRWYSLTLRPQRKKQKAAVKEKSRDEDLEDLLNSILSKASLNDDDDDDDEVDAEIAAQLAKAEESEDEAPDKKEYPMDGRLPHPRFNATTCVVDDTLYIFGGVWECGDQEFNIDSMYAIDLGKLDGVKVFWEDLSEVENAVEGSDEDEDDDSDDDSDDEEPESQLLVAEEEEEEEPEDETEPEIPDIRPWLPHPKAFESLRGFYVRTGANFLEWAIFSNREARGKHLKKAAFDMCEGRYWERREQVRITEDELEELGGVGEIVEKDPAKAGSKRR
ncbi:hypothetical protein BABINDRAFT_163589 [Babjeviella inositovora NRRL Y-12698]|uniref:DUF4110 domain-containing protein n=1 Tax=Babjeviella inositovora NRRL Y-12698 TaxID=984486 RepID=A0A1E3QI70_9ASCO|nr:uncharacterized protein BABINDRAFT_163589 [Babjeviella inositovora NRRL Y-12698]ODQ77330.1 hypothetical protein BABINDRAFT_163589 [Babjeviella inositovora NRRL Y-12698]